MMPKHKNVKLFSIEVEGVLVKVREYDIKFYQYYK